MEKSILVAAIIGALLSACDKKKEPKTVVPEPPKAEVSVAKPEFAATDSFKVGIGNVYEGYLRIEAALAQDDFQGAKSAFESMHLVLHTLPKEGMDSSALGYWDSLDTRLMKVLHPMASSNDIATMRDHLADFTPLMLDAIEKFGVMDSDPVFLFHCPMAKNNRGADWLQKDSSLRNPFLGKAMPQCGAIVKEVKI